jgi:NADH:quinone reductase (non-electrogenic)
VELAGAIADLARMALAKDFKAIDTTKARVRIYEGSPRVLGTFSAESSERARRQLQELGVDVHTDSTVTAIEPGRLRVGNEWIATDVILWATGVAASALGKELDAATDRAGRVLVEPDLSVPGHREIFVVGDTSALTGADGKPVPGLAAAATQEGGPPPRTSCATCSARPVGRSPITTEAPWRRSAIAARSGNSARESCRVHSRGCSGRSCTCSC